MKASGSPPIYCFPLLYCLNFIAQFDKLSQGTTNSEKFDFSRPNGKKKRQIRDSETARPIQNASAISRSVQTFLRPTFVQVPFYTLILSALSEDAMVVKPTNLA